MEFWPADKQKSVCKALGIPVFQQFVCHSFNQTQPYGLKLIMPVTASDCGFLENIIQTSLVVPQKKKPSPSASVK